MTCSPCEQVRDAIAANIKHTSYIAVRRAGSYPEAGAGCADQHRRAKVRPPPKVPTREARLGSLDVVSSTRRLQLLLHTPQVYVSQQPPRFVGLDAKMYGRSCSSSFGDRIQALQYRAVRRAGS